MKSFSENLHIGCGAIVTKEARILFRLLYRTREILYLMLSEKTQVGHVYEVEIAKQIRKSDSIIVVMKCL